MTGAEKLSSEEDGGGQAIFSYFPLRCFPDFSLLSSRTGKKRLGSQQG